MKTPIHVIFFDAAETLFHINGSVAGIYLKHAIQHGFRQTPDSQALIAEAFQRAFRDATPPVFAATDPIKLKQSERLWWFDIVHNVFYRVGMFERILDDGVADIAELFHSLGMKLDVWTLDAGTPGWQERLARIAGAGVDIVTTNTPIPLATAARPLASP